MTAALALLPLTDDLAPVELSGDGPFEIGRDPASAVVVSNPAVSRHHARIVRGQEGFEIEDRSGSAGIWVDGIHLGEGDRAQLVDGTMVKVGPAAFLVRDANEAAAAAAEAHAVPTSTTEPKPKTTSDPYATRESIFLRLRADGTLDRQLGWNDFHARYAPVIAGFARNAGLSEAEVDDVVQDVILGFFRKHDSFEYDPSKGRFRGYLKCITVNAVRDRWRRRKKVVELSPDHDPASEDPMDARWEREWAETMLRRALEEVRQKVQPRTMQAFELYGIKGMPIEAVEKETGMSAAAIRHAKMRILHDLQDLVRRYRQQEG